MKKTTFTIVCLFIVLTIFAKTWTVRTIAGAGVDFTSIKSAIENASVVDGDVLDVLGDFSTEQITLSKEITIKGNGQDNTIIRSAGTNRIFVSFANEKKFTITDLTIQGGTQSNEPGAGFFVYLAPECTFENVRFKDMNTSSNGGAILIQNTLKFTIRNCEFVNNKAGAVGGCIYLSNLGGVGLIENSTFEGNGAVNNGWGDAIILDNGSAVGDSLLIQNCTFFNNGKNNVGLGGTIAINYGNIKIGFKNNTFASNRGNDNVGDLFLIPNSGWPNKLSYIGNLFYESRGIVIPNGYPKPAYVAYNLSTNSINVQEGIEHIDYDPTTNVGNCVAGTDIKVELNAGVPYLKDNGGKVRTIKLTGSTFEDNLAIEFIAEPVGAPYDARGVARKSNYQDCGAYEVTSTTSINENRLNNLTVMYDRSNSRLLFTESLSGKVIITDLSGRAISQKWVLNDKSLPLQPLSNGVYIVSFRNYNGVQGTSKIIVQ
ncbi:MAG: T9SS type A sorting domain-containing protein [Paludibacter sp.]|jgi:hypothetical protein|nr:T9SS type A sorting domain-containing protein [Paludibacter sp.]